MAQHGVTCRVVFHLGVQDGDVAAVQVVAVEAVLGVGGVSGVVELSKKRERQRNGETHNN